MAGVRWSGRTSLFVKTVVYYQLVVFCLPIPHSNQVSAVRKRCTKSQPLDLGNGRKLMAFGQPIYAGCTGLLIAPSFLFSGLPTTLTCAAWRPLGDFDP